MTGLPQPRRAPDRNLDRNDAVETHLPRGYAQAALRCPAAVPEANECPGLAAFALGAAPRSRRLRAQTRGLRSVTSLWRRFKCGARSACGCLDMAQRTSCVS